MRVIVTGSRKWESWRAVDDALWGVFKEHGPFELRHGACATGADWMAHLWYERCGAHLGCTEVCFPAAWEARGKQAGPERNQRMVEAGADLVLAFPLPEGSGTQHTMKLAREAGIEVIEH
jgi:SLOG family YspA-like protein